jgi:hypothetical protein
MAARRSRRRPWGRLTALLLVCGCHPYSRFNQGGDELGPIDPVTFPAANLGDGGDRLRPGRGTFTALRAFVAADAEVSYFYYPARAPSATLDPLRVREGGAPYGGVPTPNAYVFDGDDTNPIPAHYSCGAPAGYAYNPLVEDVRFDEQGNVFAELPRATYNVGVASTSSYAPVVSAVPVSSAGRACQDLKSTAQVDAALGAPRPNGKFLAWMIIEPGAPVYPVGEPAKTMHNGLGLQRWGWFNRYLLAYLDGGYVPTEDGMDMATMKPVTRMKTQRLYYPRSMVVTTAADGKTTMAAGKIRAGYDVLAARRGDPGYSPVCEVFTYDAGMPLPVEQLPRDAKVIEAMFNTMAAPLTAAATPYTYCLQVR